MIKLQTVIVKLEKEMEDAQTTDTPSKKPGDLDAETASRCQGTSVYSTQIASLPAQIRMAARELQELQKRQQKIEKDLLAYQRRIESAPMATPIL